MGVEKIVLHVKNLVFVRVILLVLVIAALLKGVTQLQEGISKKQRSFDNAVLADAAVQQKLQAITGLDKENLKGFYRRYEEYIEDGYSIACVERLDFIRRIKELQLLLSLDSEISVDITSHTDSSWREQRKSVRVQDSVITIKFAVENLVQFGSAVTYVESIMPRYASMRYAVADMQEFLTPEVIGSLKVTGGASLILCEVSIDIREIVLL